MRLSNLHEQVLPQTFQGVFTLTGHADDTNQLVAYRVRMRGHIQNIWIVNLNGQALCHISKRDSRWVHDNWDWTYFYKDVQTVMTAENRKYLDGMLKKLIYAIKDAVTARNADVVALPIDPAQLHISNP